MSSMGRTASAPYTRAKGVWPVARFGIVLIGQRTVGKSSIQRLPLWCSLSKVLVLRPRSTSAFALSAWPLLRGCATGSETDLAAEVFDVLHEGVACELRAIVGDDSVWHTEAANWPLEEFDG